MLKQIFGAALIAASLGTVSIAADAKPTDPQIAHIAYTAGQIDVTAAEQALKKSKNVEVIEFAKTMPISGWRHLSKASQPTMAPLSRSTFGW